VNIIDFEYKHKSTALILEIINESLINVRSTIVQDTKQHLSFNQFRKSHGCITINLGRQRGHSTAAALMLYACDDALVFTGNRMSSVSEIIRKLEFIPEPKKIEMMARILVVNSNTQQFRTNRIDKSAKRSIIIFDDVYCTYERTLENILDDFNSAELIVQLQ